MISFKERIEDYTEEDFLELLGEFRNSTRQDKSLNNDEVEDYIDRLTDHFMAITAHPASSDLIFYPESPEAREPENILKIVKEWRRSQGLPLFKDSK